MPSSAARASPSAFSVRTRSSSAAWRSASSALTGLSPWPALALLAAYALFAVALSPVAGAAAIRNAQG